MLIQFRLCNSNLFFPWFFWLNRVYMGCFDFIIKKKYFKFYNPNRWKIHFSSKNIIENLILDYIIQKFKSIIEILEDAQEERMVEKKISFFFYLTDGSLSFFYVWDVEPMNCLIMISIFRDFLFPLYKRVACPPLKTHKTPINWII